MTYKLFNFRCINPDCGKDYESLLSKEDRDDMGPVTCNVCGAEAVPFDFKSNSQQWEYLDKRG